MHSHLFQRQSHGPSGPGGLYAPQSRQGLSENVHCPDIIGIGCIATDHATKPFDACGILVYTDSDFRLDFFGILWYTTDSDFRLDFFGICGILKFWNILPGLYSYLRVDPHKKEV
jgi:hypothetical protein